MGHGITTSEVRSAVKTASRIGAGPAVYIGTAPVNAGDLTKVNVPVVCYTLAEYVTAFGPIVPSSAWGEFTLAEAASAHFELYNTGPVVFINVLDPTNGDHVSQIVTSPATLNDDDEAFVELYGGDLPLLGVVKSTVVVRTGSVGGTIRVLDTDYSLAFDDDGYLVITRITTGAIAEGAILYVSADYLDPSGVVAADIIGGYDAGTGTYTGIEVVEQVFPVLRLAPGKVLAPTWSQTPSVAARLAVVARNINGMFKASAIVDLSDDGGEIANYAAAAAWKADNGYTGVGTIPVFGKITSGDDSYNGATVYAAVAGVTDAANGGTPHESPSNKAVIGEAMTHDGDELALTVTQANALNDQGIVTFLNGPNGWTVWGNRNGAYPGNTDVKDSMIPVRRMFDYVETVLVLTVWADVDSVGNVRQIQTVKGTVQGFIDGLVAAGKLYPSRVEFRADENPAIQVADGHYVFHITMTPPSPMEEIEFVLEYDAAALTSALAAI